MTGFRTHTLMTQPHQDFYLTPQPQGHTDDSMEAFTDEAQTNWKSGYSLYVVYVTGAASFFLNPEQQTDSSPGPSLSQHFSISRMTSVQELSMYLWAVNNNQLENDGQLVSCLEEKQNNLK